MIFYNKKKGLLAPFFYVKSIKNKKIIKKKLDKYTNIIVHLYNYLFINLNFFLLWQE